MEPYIIAGTEDTPAITLDSVNNIYSFSGRSLPEDVNTFYKPTMEWLAKFGENPKDMQMEIKLEYFNTASSKILLDILMLLDEVSSEKGVAIKIIWMYDSNDEDMLEAGEEFSELVSLPFESKSY